MDWKPYDPTWMVDLAREQSADEPWLTDALARCTRAMEDGRAYLYFVDPIAPNEPGSDWQFDKNLTLEHPREGTLVLDILTGRRVGGIEFISRL